MMSHSPDFMANLIFWLQRKPASRHTLMATRSIFTQHHWLCLRDPEWTSCCSLCSMLTSRWSTRLAMSLTRRHFLYFQGRQTNNLNNNWALTPVLFSLPRRWRFKWNIRPCSLLHWCITYYLPITSPFWSEWLSWWRHGTFDFQYNGKMWCLKCLEMHKTHTW